jgi:Ribbon-helix-helix domain
VHVSNDKPNTQMAPFNIARRDADALKALSIRTRVAQASYLREAVADLLRKYAKELHS